MYSSSSSSSSSMEEIRGKLLYLEEEARFLRFAGMLADPLTRRIMAKLASPQSPISVDGIPVRALHADKGAVVSRLSKLERAGLVRSEKVRAATAGWEEDEHGFCRKYLVSESGRKLVSDYIVLTSRDRANRRLDKEAACE